MRFSARYIIAFVLFCSVALAQNSSSDTLNFLLQGIPDDSLQLKKLISASNELIKNGNLTDAFELTDKAIVQVEKSKANRNFLRYLQSIIGICIDHGNYPKAMEYCFKVKHLAEQINETAIKGDAVNTIGIIYWYEGENKKALSFYEDALKIHQQVNGSRAAAGILNNMGLVYRQMNEYDKAIEYYKKAIYYSQKSNREEGEANAYNNLGIVYQLKKEYFNALLYFKLSLDIRTKIKDDIGIATSLGNIGAVYFETKKYKEAEEFYRKSFAISKGLDDWEGVKEIGKNICDLYEFKKNTDSALKYYKIYIAARDTLINEETKRDALKREIEYKYEKESEKKAILDEADKRKQKIFTTSIFIILGLITIFAVVLMQRIRITHRQKRVIEEKNKEILDSIHYAKRIQQSLLTSEKYIERSIGRLKGIKKI